MTATAKLRYLRTSPQKVRLVTDLIRGLPVDEAMTTLKLTNKRAAPKIAKLLQSAVANAEEAGDVDVDELKVSEIFVDEGPRLKRLRPAPMGRAYRYFHRLAHVTLRVSDGQPDEIDENEE